MTSIANHSSQAHGGSQSLFHFLIKNKKIKSISFTMIMYAQRAFLYVLDLRVLGPSRLHEVLEYITVFLAICIKFWICIINHVVVDDTESFHAHELYRIMFHLPTQDVVRCMQVCKYWKVLQFLKFINLIVTVFMWPFWGWGGGRCGCQNNP